MINEALLTDLYELTMLAGYYDHGLQHQPATFDLFFRHNPFMGGYAVFAGLEPALEYLERLAFSPDDLAYLESLHLFPASFLGHLEGFRFRGRVIAPPEGTIVFPNEPILSVEGGLAEAQLVETILLNIINFQTLAATKAARIVHAAGAAEVIEFGLRRAQGPDGALSLARAAYIGGVRSTSNVLAGKTFGIPVRGTHAHSWIMAFPDELSAFRAYAQTFPDGSVFLVDSYDTIRSGVPNAITVGLEMKERGHRLRGIRIDSGDLAWQSREARRMLDTAGLSDVRIIATNELDEHVIDSLRNQGGCIDIYGVGTRLATCAGEGGGALGGVYKLVEADGLPRLKVTGDVTKATLPGRKRLFRGRDAAGRLVRDVICRADEAPQAGQTVFDPLNPLLHSPLPDEVLFSDIRTVVMEEGCRTDPRPSLDEISLYRAGQVEALPEEYLRLLNPHRYKVSVSSSLQELRLTLRDQIAMRLAEQP